jgi:hypothetical protein
MAQGEGEEEEEEDETVRHSTVQSTWVSLH